VTWLHVTNPTTAALSFLLLVLFVAVWSRRWVAIMTSVVAAGLLDFYFLPPVGTLSIGDPQEWVAFFSFVVVSLVASHLSSIARAREHELRSVELKSTLLASLAHDLHTPLTAIRTAVNNLSASSLTDIQRSDQVHTALTGLDRLTRLFQNVLEMGRIDVGGVTLSPRWVHPSEVIEAARSQVDHALRAHDFKVVALSNGRLIVCVDDEGPGIVAAEKLRIFERFYRGSAAHSHASGTGMGLAIVQGLLIAQGGRAWAEDRAGRGARFSIRVPAECRVIADE
jgi:two-component system sensor histidine kinase KdpD